MEHLVEVFDDVQQFDVVFSPSNVNRSYLGILSIVGSSELCRHHSAAHEPPLGPKRFCELSADALAAFDEVKVALVDATL
ncbi:hypothetical protein SprV_0702360900 [Sparganum proliferum]